MGPLNATAGLDDIKLVRSQKYSDTQKLPKKKVLGTFGVMQGEYKNSLSWVVSPRKDMRHGVVNRPAPKDEYLESLFNKMFKGWHE